ncbi:MAG: acetyltransferase [Isosphaeraceae bacterium]
MMGVWILGARGQAKVVIDSIRSARGHEIEGILDDDASLHGRSLLGIAIQGPITPESIDRLRIRHAVIAIGSNQAREQIAERLSGRVGWPTVVHPRASLACGVVLGEGTVVFAGAVIQPDATIGRHVIINTCCSVDHECLVGDFAHIAPGAHLAGNCEVGAGALLGIGCSVIPGRTIGAGAVVGAGAAVVSDIPPRVTAVGVPARWS